MGGDGLLGGGGKRGESSPFVGVVDFRLGFIKSGSSSSEEESFKSSSILLLFWEYVGGRFRFKVLLLVLADSVEVGTAARARGTAIGRGVSFLSVTMSMELSSSEEDNSLSMDRFGLGPLPADVRLEDVSLLEVDGALLISRLSINCSCK